MPSLSQKLKRAGVKAPRKRSEPVWKGPEIDGVTQSLLSRFLVCRERFRLRVVEGLKPIDTFNHRLEYGNMWHVCEEAYAANSHSGVAWTNALKEYAQSLTRKYPLQQEQILHWYMTCAAQFPLYVVYWAKHRDTVDRTPLLQEQTFSVPYRLPSGRVVRLRGKWDSVDLIGTAGIYIQENKTKGDIDEQQVRRQLSCDLQSMIYAVALTHQFPPGTKSLPPGAWDNPFKGIRYNVVRRPFSGGKGSITKGKGTPEFYARLATDYIAKEPEYWFMRWTVELTPADLAKFRRETLDPILQCLCEWWDWAGGNCSGDPFAQSGGGGIHYRTPFGLYNPMAEGGGTDLDECLASGSEVGLRRVDNLFPELE